MANRFLTDKILAGFVGMTFLIVLGLVGAYLIFSSLFICGGQSCSSAAWSGLFLVAAGLLTFIICLLGHYDTRYYLDR